MTPLAHKSKIPASRDWSFGGSDTSVAVGRIIAGVIAVTMMSLMILGMSVG